MAPHTEPGEVVQGVDSIECAECNPRGVELRCACNHGTVAFGRKPVFFQCRAVDTHAKRFSKNQGVARFGTRVSLQVSGFDQPYRDQAIDRFDRIDGVAAGNRDAGFRAHCLSAFENPANGLDWKFFDRHPDQCQRKERRATHCVYVGDGVGCSDRAEVVRVVDDRHEKIGRGDDCLTLVDLINRSVVCGLDTYEELLMQRYRGRRLGDNLLQYAWRDLAAAAAAVAELGKAQGGAVGCVHELPRLAFKVAALGTEYYARLSAD